VLQAIPPQEWTLVIDDLSDLTLPAARLLDRLASRFTVFAATEQLRPAHDKHFWRFERLPLRPLPAADARRLLRQAAAGADIEDPRLFETQLHHQTAGNPRAILESVARLRKEPAITPDLVRDFRHPGARQPIDITPLVVVLVFGLVAFRFVARGLGDLELYVFTGVAAMAAMAVRYFLFRAGKR
jgi:hypothetical protein